MQSIAIGTLVFACTFGGVLAGMQLRALLPQHHFDEESKDAVKVAIGLVATMTALILGLVTASAQSSFNALDATVKRVVAHVLTLDRALARYGPEAREVRGDLQRFVEQRIASLWPQEARGAQPDVVDVTLAEQLTVGIRQLAPQSDEQRWLKSRAVQLGEGLLEARWSVFSSMAQSVPGPFLAVLVFWLTMIFASFGLFAPRNATVLAALFVCSISVAGAIFLILEMDSPFTGMIRISPAPARYALAHINR